jgi:hypothetical protein
MDSLKIHPGPPSPTLLCPACGPPLKRHIWPFQGWPAHRAGSLGPSSTPLDTPCRTPMFDLPSFLDLMPLFSLRNQNDENRKNDKSDTFYHSFCNYVKVIVENVEVFLWFCKIPPCMAHTHRRMARGVQKGGIRRRTLALRADYTRNSCKSVSGVACQQGVGRHGRPG